MGFYGLMFRARQGGCDAKGGTRSLASRLVPLVTAQRGLQGFGGVTRGGPCVARGLGRATGDTTRKAGRARRPRGRSRWRPRSASFGGATWGGHAAASPDLDIAGLRVAQGLGHATGDTTRRV